MAMAAHGMRLPSESWELWVVALRSRRRDRDWPDLVGPLWLDDDQVPHMSLVSGMAKTDPLVLPGQYPGSLCLGRRLGIRPALVQCRPFRYQGGPGEIIEEVDHTDLIRPMAHPDVPVPDQPWSRCMVMSDVKAYEAMMDLCRHCAEKRGSSFGLILMEWDSR
jgi:hypothetical protein